MKLVSTVMRNLMVALVAILFMAPSMVQAQGAAWKPSFNQSQQVYIDPALANDPDFPVAMPGLDAKLMEVSSKHNIKIIAIAVKQTNERGANPAADKLDEILLRWQSSPGFPSDNYFVVVWMRSATNPSEGWVAANAGSDLKTYGFGKAMLDSRDGPILTAGRKYMPQDPKGFYTGVAVNVNKVIDDYNAAQQSAKDHDALMGWVWIIVIVLVVVGAAVFGLRVLNKAKAGVREQANTVLTDWNTKMESANALYLKLRSGYIGFVSDQGDWKTKFNGDTLTDYKAALTNFADFSTRRTKANQVLAEARKLFESGKYSEVLKKLNDEIIVIDGKELPIEELTLFGGLVQRSEYKPNELLNSMASLFDNTNKTLAAIMKALKEAKQAGDDLDAAQAEIETQRGRLGTSGFAKFAADFEVLVRDEAKVREQFKGDPVTTKDAMLALLARANKIKDAAIRA